ncbi:hypothetical protein BCU12_15175 [Vibrio sp. 10N.261.55.A7]|nr:hypothetical protein BCU12_15175 [Vibrio sp. 10N.261.55.A7]
MTLEQTRALATDVSVSVKGFIVKVGHLYRIRAIEIKKGEIAFEELNFVKMAFRNRKPGFHK